MEQGLPPIGWTVIGQREDYRPGPTGAFVPGVVITFRTAGGHTGSVFLPDTAYTIEIARAAIAARAIALDAVGLTTGLG